MSEKKMGGIEAFQRPERGSANFRRNVVDARPFRMYGIGKMGEMDKAVRRLVVREG